MGAEANHTSDLKRLEFVRSYSGYFWGKTSDIATYVYSNSRAYTQKIPQLDSGIKNLEGAADKYATPVIVSVQDTSEKTLKILDNKVDGAFVALADVLERQRAFHEKNVAWFNNAKDRYLNKICEATNFLKADGLKGAARVTADTLMQKVEEARSFIPSVPSALTEESKQLMSMIRAMWEKLATNPTVHRSIQAFQPPLNRAWEGYISAHDSLVASPSYHKAVDTSADIIHRAQETQVYKAAAKNVYPRVSPYLDPVLDKVITSPPYQAVANHLKPLPNGSANGHIPTPVTVE